MNYKIREVAELLLYSGPDMSDIISKAIEQGNSYSLDYDNHVNILSITSLLPYDLEVTDKFFYNNDKQLIKQILLMNGKERVVFDKFKEAQNKLNKLKSITKVVA